MNSTGYDEQLAKWVAGDPVHIGDGASGQCCPDFSCCQPGLLAPKRVREIFRDADEATRMGILGHFLGAALALAAEGSDKSVYIAGQGAEN